MLKKLLAFILVIAALQSVAQRAVVPNLTTFDDKQLRFGYTLGMNAFDYQFAYLDEDGFIGEIPSLTPGFIAGLLVNYRLGQYFDLRANPNLSFGTANFKFNDEFYHSTALEATTSNTGKLNMINMDVPLVIKYKAKRIGNSRPYIIVGGSYRHELSRAAQNIKNLVDSGSPSINWINLDKSNFFLDVGAGLDNYLQFTKIAFELRYSFGLNNALSKNIDLLKTEFNIKDSDSFVNNITSLRIQVITLSIHFQ